MRNIVITFDIFKYFEDDYSKVYEFHAWVQNEKKSWNQTKHTHKLIIKRKNKEKN